MNELFLIVLVIANIFFSVAHIVAARPAYVERNDAFIVSLVGMIIAGGSIFIVLSHSLGTLFSASLAVSALASLIFFGFGLSKASGESIWQDQSF